jgi:hypothetical protein
MNRRNSRIISIDVASRLADAPAIVADALIGRIGKSALFNAARCPSMAKSGVIAEIAAKIGIQARVRDASLPF